MDPITISMLLSQFGGAGAAGAAGAGAAAPAMGAAAGGAPSVGAGMPALSGGSSDLMAKLPGLGGGGKPESNVKQGVDGFFAGDKDISKRANAGRAPLPQQIGNTFQQELTRRRGA